MDKDNLRKDAKKQLDKATKDDKALKEKVSGWRRVNRKWLMRPRRKEKSKERGNLANLVV